ncbi:hypothetical protein BY996DRAFT_1646956 [Phakopsora pachyrhizi]|nr:hypothetical protein BY996DRAFT_1646956 [Phakopsora pachyrhizi]
MAHAQFVFTEAIEDGLVKTRTKKQFSTTPIITRLAIGGEDGLFRLFGIEEAAEGKQEDSNGRYDKNTVLSRSSSIERLVGPITPEQFDRPSPGTTPRTPAHQPHPSVGSPSWEHSSRFHRARPSESHQEVNRKASATVSITVPAKDSSESFPRPGSPSMSVIQSPASESCQSRASISLDLVNRKQSIEFLWQGFHQNHHHHSQKRLSTPTRSALGHPSPSRLFKSDSRFLSEPLELISSTAIINSLSDHSDSIINIKIFKNSALPSWKIDSVNIQAHHPAVAIVLTRFGKLFKLSLLDGHLIDSTSLTGLDEGLIGFEDFVPFSEKQDEYLFCFALEYKSLAIVRAFDFRVIARFEDLSANRYSRIRAQGPIKDQDGWTFNLYCIDQASQLIHQPVKVKNGSAGRPWQINLGESSIVQKLPGKFVIELTGLVLRGKLLGIWSSDRFCVLEKCETQQQDLLVASRIKYLDDEADDRRWKSADGQIISLIFLSSCMILAVVTRSQIKFFKFLQLDGVECQSGWSHWKLRALDDGRFLLEEHRHFELVTSEFPPLPETDSRGRGTSLYRVGFFSVDFDQKTGQRRISHLHYESRASSPRSRSPKSVLVDQKTVAQPDFSNRPIFNELFHSMPLDSLKYREEFENSIRLTVSVWLEDEIFPTLLVGDSAGRLLIYSISAPVSSSKTDIWKLQRCIDKERLGGAISALYVDEKYVIAGDTTGEIGVWEKDCNTSKNFNAGKNSGKVDMQLINRLIISAVPLERFGHLTSHKLIGNKVFASLPMDGSVVVWSIEKDGSVSVRGELHAEEATAGVDQLWCNGHEELVIFYRERRLGAQRWFFSKQLWASMSRKEAKAMIDFESSSLDRPSWSKVCLLPQKAEERLGEISSVTKAGSIHLSGTLGFNTISLRLRDFMDSIGLQNGPQLVERLWMVRLFLAELLPWGADKALDECAKNDLKIPNYDTENLKNRNVIYCGRDDRSTLTMKRAFGAKRAMNVSEKTYRILCVVVLLRVFLNEARYERHASETIARIARLAAGGSSTDSTENLNGWIDITVLVRFWMDGSSEIREAARLLFGVKLGTMSNEEITKLVSSWQNLLPFQDLGVFKSNSALNKSFAGSTESLVNLSDLEFPPSIDVPEAIQADAILLIGLIASERYKLFPREILKDLSIAVFQAVIPAAKNTELDPANLNALICAIEVCSKTFEIVQNYVDAIELLRALFGWATGKGGDQFNALRRMASHACLHVASVNTPLFMTTLSYDIMTSQDPVDRISTMKLVIFMVRKKPLILHASLPRLVEAVVKSLDPTYKSMRAKTQTAATVILHELVKTYPSVTFHGPSQRLAIGTLEGAIIIYDLKTSTRINVLESYRKSVTACSFSPDGHRLVTVSLDEGRAEVWKVGAGLFRELISTSSSSNSSNEINNGKNRPEGDTAQGGFTGFFKFGGIMGNSNKNLSGANKPFKVFPFNVGDEGLMSLGGTLEWVRIDWLGGSNSRSCRLRIRESSLTFSC